MVQTSKTLDEKVLNIWRLFALLEWVKVCKSQKQTSQFSHTQKKTYEILTLQGHPLQSVIK